MPRKAPAKLKVPLFQRPMAHGVVEEGATAGAVLGVNLYDAAGELVDLAALIAAEVGALAPTTTVGATTWPLILDVPPNVQQVAALATNGVVVRKSDGGWVTRTIEGVAGETTSAEEDGETGNPTIGLWTVGAGAAMGLYVVQLDTKGRVIAQNAASADDVPISDGGWSVLSGDTVQAAMDSADAAIAAREPAIPAGTTAQFWRGDKAWSNTLVGELGAAGLFGQAGSSSLNIYQPTADGADTARVAVAGGATQNANRGGFSQWHGNEHATFPGRVRHVAGSLGTLDFSSGATMLFDFRIQVLGGGTALAWAPATMAAFQRTNGTTTACQISVVSGNASTATMNFGDTDAEDVAFIRYNHSTETFSWKVGGTANVLLLTTAQLTLPATMADGDNTTAAASTAYARKAAPNASYRNLHDRVGSHTAGQATGTYAVAMGDPLPISGTGTLAPWGVFYLDPADFPTVNSLTTKLRVRGMLTVNDTAPGASFVIGLHPVTHTGATGGAGLGLFTIGAAVAGSTVTINTPAADSQNQGNSGDFAIPAAGWYCLGVVQSGAAVAASSHLFIGATLQMRNT